MCVLESAVPGHPSLLPYVGIGVCFDASGAHLCSPGSDHIPFLDAGYPAVLLIERDNMHPGAVASPSFVFHEARMEQCRVGLDLRRRLFSELPLLQASWSTRARSAKRECLENTSQLHNCTTLQKYASSAQRLAGNVSSNTHAASARRLSPHSALQPTS